MKLEKKSMQQLVFLPDLIFAFPILTML